MPQAPDGMTPSRPHRAAIPGSPQNQSQDSRQSRRSAADSAARTGSAAGQGRTVFDAEVLGPEQDQRGGPQHGSGPQAQSQQEGLHNRHSEGFQGSFRAGQQGQQFYFRRVWSSGMGGFGQGNFRSGPIGGRSSCLAPVITLTLFLVCLAQYGFLAALGFIFFHTVGSVLGSMREMRLLVQGRISDPRLWRLGNWCVSFLLTVWLAGGFQKPPQVL